MKNLVQYVKQNKKQIAFWFLVCALALIVWDATTKP
jgi:hypothetical protein